MGVTTSGVLVFAVAGPNGNNNAVFVYSSANTLTKTTLTSVPSATALATTDLNGDKNNDLIVVNGYNASGSSISVLLGNADGTFQTPVSYATEGTIP